MASLITLNEAKQFSLVKADGATPYCGGDL